VFFGITSVGGVAIVVSIFLSCFLGENDVLRIDDLTVSYASKIMYLDSQGKEKELESLSPNENKIWVDSCKIPKSMKDAIIAVEDERFYSHFGFDVLRTTKAFLNWIFRKDSSYGGSTITQQLVKNLTREQDKTAIRKIKEISRAISLERKFSKEQILELYLNTIYLSQGCYGVQSASHKFFGKDVEGLSLAECACIAGITQYPVRYDPIANPKNNKEKQKIVLKKMLEIGYITQKDHDKALKEKLSFSKSSSNLQGSSISSYFADKVVEDVLGALKKKGYSDSIADKMLYEGGLKIYSTYDPKIQSIIDKVYKDNNNFPKINEKIAPQSAIVVIEPKSGAIVGMAGGIGAKTASRTLNRAAQTLRQPGSTLKPLSAYAPALENKLINSATILKDEEIKIGDWICKNYDKKFSGKVDIRQAVNYSLNTSPVEVIKKLTLNNSYNFLVNNLGFTSLVEKETINGEIFSDIGYPQLALGGLTKGVKIIELASAYAVFSNGGIYTKPYVFTKVLDSKEREIITNDKKTNVAMSEATAYIVAQLLNGSVKNGTSVGSQVSSGIFTAGKTGTTSDNFDRWFVGFTPYYVAALWYGYDEPKDLGISKNPNISIWKKIMDEVHNNLKNKDLEKPQEIINVNYCKNSGKLPNEHCGGNITNFYFTRDNAPKDVCAIHNAPVRESE
jgi:penicillin-binding protein 1A